VKCPSEVRPRSRASASTRSKNNTATQDAFVTKLNPLGTAPLVYSTYLGGNDQRDPAEDGFGIAIDGAGEAHVTGRTGSTDFPTTPGAYQTSYGGGIHDAFVTKLDATGSALVYSTYVGGGDNDIGYGIALDGSGSAYVTGTTASDHFPTTSGAFQQSPQGGSGLEQDAFVTKLNAAGSAPLIYSTYLGGSDDERGLGIAVDLQLNAYVTGFTASTDFPRANAFQPTYGGGPADAFVTKLNALGSGLVYSSFLGGDGDDGGYRIALDGMPQPSAYVAGQAASGFPTTPGAYQTSFGGGPADAFVAKVSSAPGRLTLTPPTATNPVDTQHCVTATVEDAGGTPVAGVTVRFTVTGSVSASGSATTDEDGQATFCYMGPPLPGADVITAYADADDDAAQDPQEPTGAATKAWVLPATTPLCEITITNGGRITAANGDPATFAGNARASAEGQTQGQEQYQDHGPARPMNVNSINVLAIVCEGNTAASIYGDATVDGQGSYKYRIRVQDLSDGGKDMDRYWILLQNGYDSGDQKLEGGNVQIRRQ